MGVLGDLARDARERKTPAAAAVPVDPVEGQVYSDAINPGYSWVVSQVTEEQVGLNMLDRAGEVTEAYLVWDRNRWPALAERHGLELVSAGD